MRKTCEVQFRRAREGEGLRDHGLPGVMSAGGIEHSGRGTAEQWIEEGKYAVKWTRLSCHRRYCDAAVRIPEQRTPVITRITSSQTAQERRLSEDFCDAR
jgi:hypothetical protein